MTSPPPLPRPTEPIPAVRWGQPVGGELSCRRAPGAAPGTGYGGSGADGRTGSPGPPQSARGQPQSTEPGRSAAGRSQHHLSDGTGNAAGAGLLPVDGTTDESPLCRWRHRRLQATSNTLMYCASRRLWPSCGPAGEREKERPSERVRERKRGGSARGRVDDIRLSAAADISQSVILGFSSFL